MWSAGTSVPASPTFHTIRAAPGVVVPAGECTDETTTANHVLGQERPYSGRLSMATGPLYEGTRSTLGYSGAGGCGRSSLSSRRVTLNWISLPYGDFKTRRVGTRFTVTPAADAARLNVDAKNLSSSVRLRWD